MEGGLGAGLVDFLTGVTCVAIIVPVISSSSSTVLTKAQAQALKCLFMNDDLTTKEKQSYRSASTPLIPLTQSAERQAQKEKRRRNNLRVATLAGDALCPVLTLP